MIAESVLLINCLIGEPVPFLASISSSVLINDLKTFVNVPYDVTLISLKYFCQVPP